MKNSKKRKSIFNLKYDIHSDRKDELEAFCNKFVLKNYKKYLKPNTKPDFHMYDAIYFRSIADDNFISLRLSDNQKTVQSLTINRKNIINNGKVVNKEN